MKIDQAQMVMVTFRDTSYSNIFLGLVIVRGLLIAYQICIYLIKKETKINSLLKIITSNR